MALALTMLRRTICQAPRPAWDYTGLAIADPLATFRRHGCNQSPLPGI
jgi:hypothetical protein